MDDEIESYIDQQEIDKLVAEDVKIQPNLNPQVETVDEDEDKDEA